MDSNNGLIHTVILLGIIYTVYSLSPQCSLLNPDCRCTFNNGSIIDLSNIGRTDKNPRFKSIGNKGNNANYSYNPCKNFYEGDGNCNITEGVGVCLHTTSTPFSSLGSNNNAFFNENKLTNLLEIIYNDNNTSGAIVSLVCNKDIDTLKIDGIDIINKTTYHRMTLFTHHACLGSSSKQGLSVGSILLIIFFVGCSVYFFGGMLIMKLLRGATGKEMIPHYDFWVDLPNLILDGIYFVIRGCKADTAYDRI